MPSPQGSMSLPCDPNNLPIAHARSEKIVQLRSALEGSAKIHDYLIISERAQAICQEVCSNITGSKVSTGPLFIRKLL
jgi:hypothetical protein